jgi:hypothetical protein
MMVFLIIGSLAGVLLGLRFKVLVLVPTYFDPRVRNHRNGRRMESNYPHYFGDCGAASDRVYVRSCCSFLGWSVSEQTQEPAVPAI